MLSVPAVTDLATFTGRDEASFTTFADQALVQATLLFSLRTKIPDYPADADLAALARNAILQMAERIYLEQPYAQARATPYTSETIGSYSYAKGSAAAKARDGQDTGLFWWDLALDELTEPQMSLVDSGSVSGLERDIYIDSEGVRFILGPAELNTPDTYGDTNAELDPRPRLG